MKRTQKRSLVCIKDEGCPASLKTRQLYQTIPDEQAAKMSQIRVIDESGEEDYLYPENYFAAVPLR